MNTQIQSITQRLVQAQRLFKLSTLFALLLASPLANSAQKAVGFGQTI